VQESKQKIALREWKNARGLARNTIAVRAHFVGFGLNFDVRSGAVVEHVLFPDAAAAAHRSDKFFQAQLRGPSGGDCRLRHKLDGNARRGITEAAEHWAIEEFLCAPLFDRIMDSDEFRAVGKRGLYPDFVNHFRNAVHHLAASDYASAEDHEFGTGLPSGAASITSAVSTATAST
jgi:hypothetical protein